MELYPVIGLLIGILISMLCVFFYRCGVKDGQKAVKGEKIPILDVSNIKTPVEAIKDRAEAKKEAEEAEKRQKAFDEFINYQPQYPAKRGE